MGTNQALDRRDDVPLWQGGTSEGNSAKSGRIPERRFAPPVSGQTESASGLVVGVAANVVETTATVVDRDVIWAMNATVTEIASGVVTVEASNGLTMDLPLSVFADAPKYGSPVRYEIKRRSNGTRYQEGRVLPDSGSSQAAAALEDILSKF